MTNLDDKEKIAQLAGQKNEDTISERSGYSLESLAGENQADNDIPEEIREDMEAARQRTAGVPAK